MSQQQTQKIEMTIAEAMKNLHEAKEEIVCFRASQESFGNEKSSLESAVLDLKEEKKTLEVEIQAMREELKDLENQLNESQNAAQQLESDNEMAFDSQETVLDAPPCFVVDDQSMVSTNASQNHNVVGGSMSVSTAATSSTTSATSTKRRPKKVYDSPKKWRRMIRTHRLQSIFIQNN